MSGKGSGRRAGANDKAYAENYERTFGKGRLMVFGPATIQEWYDMMPPGMRDLKNLTVSENDYFNTPNRSEE